MIRRTLGAYTSICCKLYIYKNIYFRVSIKKVEHNIIKSWAMWFYNHSYIQRTKIGGLVKTPITILQHPAFRSIREMECLLRGGGGCDFLLLANCFITTVVIDPIARRRNWNEERPMQVRACWLADYFTSTRFKKII